MAAKSFGIGTILALALAAAPALAQGNGVGSPFELAFWEAVADSGDAAQFEAYLAQYPQGTFASIARLRIAALGGQVPVTPPPPSPPLPVPVTVAAPPPLVAVPVAVAPPPPVVVAAAKPLPAAAAVVVAPPPPAAPPLPPISSGAELVARASALGADGAAPAASVALPPTPQLAPVPQVPIPPTFCSAIERNAYHDEVYRPARQVAQNNNRAAIAHLRALQELYDSYAPARDFERMNLIADSARAYEPIADDTYNVTVGYDALFDRLMAVRIVDCAGGQ